MTTGETLIESGVAGADPIGLYSSNSEGYPSTWVRRQAYSKGDQPRGDRVFMRPDNFDCTLNAAPVLLKSDAAVPVGVLPYESDDQLASLRSERRSTHLFRRHQNTIENVALSADESPIGEIEEKKLVRVPELVGAMLLESLLRLFESRNRIIRSYRPLRTESPKTENDLLRKASPNTRFPPWLKKPNLYLFDTRTVWDDEGKRTLLLTCSVRSTHVIRANCSELVERGVPIVGRYVGTRVDGDDPRLQARFRLLGRVRRIDGSKLALEDHREGAAEVDASDALLEPRIENFNLVVTSLFPGKAKRILGRLESVSGDSASGRARLGRTSSIFDFVSQAKLELCPDVPLELGPVLSTRQNENWFPYRKRLERPQLIFEPGGRKTDPYNKHGLDQYGPYDQQFFSPKRPNIAIICEEDVQGRVEEFVKKLLEGVQVVDRDGNTNYEKGLLQRFALERPGQIRLFKAKGSADSYHDACREAITYATDGGFRWDLALVQIREEFKLLPHKEDPYVVSKYVLLKHQVPSQQFLLKSIAVPDRQLAFTLNNMSLATYAKLSGIPWLLPADSTVAHELVAGLASHEVSSSRLGRNERFVGITTVFTGDGRYLLESRTAAVPFDEYSDALIKSITKAIEVIRREQNWQPNDPVRIIVHGFKPLKKLEVKAFKKVMRSLALPNLEFAFVHVVDDHPYLMFNRNELGARAYGGGVKGVWAPERGMFVRLGNLQALVALKGARELKRETDGLPEPLLLSLHPDSTFKDLTYLAQQVFNFSCHSWKTLSPAGLPITILYSEMIARLIRAFQDLPDWDEDVLLGPVGRTRWFL